MAAHVHTGACIGVDELGDFTCADYAGDDLRNGRRHTVRVHLPDGRDVDVNVFAASIDAAFDLARAASDNPAISDHRTRLDVVFIDHDNALDPYA